MRWETETRESLEVYGAANLSYAAVNICDSNSNKEEDKNEHLMLSLDLHMCIVAWTHLCLDTQNHAHTSYANVQQNKNNTDDFLKHSNNRR